MECYATYPLTTRLEFLKKECKKEPVYPPAHQHVWCYSTNLNKIDGEHIQKAIPPYDEDSLCLNIGDSEIKMIRYENGENKCYLLESPVSRHLWKNLYGQNDYMHFLPDDKGRLNGLSYQEVQDFIARLNDFVTDSLNAHVIISLPSPNEMKYLIERRQTDSTYIPAPSTTFYVDSIEISDQSIVCGQMSTKGEVEMRDAGFVDNNTVFSLKATPYESVVVGTTSYHFNRIYKRQCLKCGKIDMISKEKYYNIR